MSHQNPNSYFEGRDARNDNREKTVNPYPGMTNQWSWWLAGWNDRDIALARPISSSARGG